MICERCNDNGCKGGCPVCGAATEELSRSPDCYVDFVQRLLSLMAEQDEVESLFWGADLRFSVLCNDAFYWGCSDVEGVTPDTLAELERAFAEAGEDGALLYCARQRGMRPQGAMYRYIESENWPLFDACGPERETNVLNPQHKPNEA